MSMYRLSRQAQADLEEIADYLAQRSPTAAERVLDALYETFVALAKNPNMGTLRADLRPNLRIFTPARPAHNYVIVFYPLAGGVEVSDVLQAARDWPGMFTRGER